ncbi:hypothetical protein [Clostridium sp. CCUG 7971]|uniref:hypothetical protein n=1 Tax=Clostridium sp. CCUG 7971 TaxID=2811414 RepID=UPI001ABA8ECF|nr:hypothetical protein [Clostridium sp. CCUG 7971]MBO3444885.1 hypothetical protein [Clostridium sp. CCUG 7971]
MKKYIYLLYCILFLSLLIFGYKSIKSIDSVSKEIVKTANNQGIDGVSEEAKKIAKEQGYSIKVETKEYVMNGDAEVSKLMKKACIKGGYSPKNFKNIKGELKTFDYELEERSKFEDDMIYLSLLVDSEESVIGSFLNYAGAEHIQSYKPVNFKDDFK